MCLRTGAQLVEREIADSNGDVKVRVSVDLNCGFNQRLKVVGAETGLPAPGTPARPINCTSEGESQTEDEVERERAARRGARSKRKAKPSPRNDGNDDVIDRRGDLIRTMVHVGPVTQCREQGHMKQLQMPDTDIVVDRKSGLRPSRGNDSTDLAVGRCMR